MAQAISCDNLERSTNAPNSGGRTVVGSEIRTGSDSLALDLLYRIGDLDGSGDYTFGSVSAVAPTSDGGFFACDMSLPSIRQFDPAGRFLRTVGRPGAGPGEYERCDNIVVSRDSSLAILDLAHARIVRFGQAARHLGDVPLREALGLFGENALIVDSAGWYWRLETVLVDGLAERELPLRLFAVDLEGRRVDSVDVPRQRESAFPGFAFHTSDGIYRSHPYDSVFAMDGRRTLAVASTGSYRIELRRRDGTSIHIARAAPSVQYGRKEHAEWEAWRAYYASKGPAPVAVPTEKPAIRGLRLDDLGRLWVHVHVAAEQRQVPKREAGDDRPLFSWRERNTFDLFDGATGAWIGRVALPAESEFMASQNDWVWLRQEGEEGQPQIGVYRLRAAEGRSHAPD